jgi:hypothetical protein
LKAWGLRVAKRTRCEPPFAFEEIVARMSIDALNCQSGALRARGHAENDTLTLALEGDASFEAVDVVRRILDATHAQAQTLRVKEVVMDVRALEFINSSGVKCFVSWLQRVAELPSEDGYRIRFVSNRALTWQRRGLDALRCFAPDIVTVDTNHG